MVKIIRYVVGSMFILIFVSSVLEGAILLLPNSPFYTFLRLPGGPPEFNNTMMQFMHFGQLAGMIAIFIGFLCLIIGLVVLFARVK